MGCKRRNREGGEYLVNKQVGICIPEFNSSNNY